MAAQTCEVNQAPLLRTADNEGIRQDNSRNESKHSQANPEVTCNNRHVLPDIAE
jgi:hypothetical protein